MMERLLAVGAGYVGGAFAEEAARLGYDVYALRRSAQTLSGVTMVQGDVTRPDGSWTSFLPERIDHIVVTIAPARSAGGASDGYEETYLGGMKGALKLVDRLGAKRLLYTSSTGVYAANGGEFVDETSPVVAEGSQGILRQAEEVAMASSVQTIILRLSGLYGPGRDPRPRYRDIASLAAGGEYWTNRVHRDDAVRGILHALQMAEGNAVYNCTDDEPAKAADVARWLAEQEGRDHTVPATGEGEPRSNKRIANGRLRSLGWGPEYPTFREGFLALDN